MSWTETIAVPHRRGATGVLMHRVACRGEPVDAPRPANVGPLAEIWLVHNEIAVRSLGPTDGHTATRLDYGLDWMVTGDRLVFSGMARSQGGPADLLLVYDAPR